MDDDDTDATWTEDSLICISSSLFFSVFEKIRFIIATADLGSVHFPGKSKQTIRRLVDSSGKNFVQGDSHTKVQLFEKVFAPDESTIR